MRGIIVHRAPRRSTRSVGERPDASGSLECVGPELVRQPAEVLPMIADR
jgi:hypothetical protein